ncbi:hypothetical protein EYR41_004350 [Orbilia oligospora]|uniref:DUF6987 domain-containing protein n=1 Tax=Orbilia oligospora TaxID=2813651 RepID=A0A8H2E8S3_ORBOL|nr:hypothetical protein EYR41_004350 [Orbilia oligospora]
MQQEIYELPDCGWWRIKGLYQEIFATSLVNKDLSGYKGSVTPSNHSDETSLASFFISAPSTPPLEGLNPISTNISTPRQSRSLYESSPESLSPSDSMSAAVHENPQQPSEGEHLNVLDPQALSSKASSDFGGKENIENPEVKKDGKEETEEEAPKELTEEEKQQAADEEERAKVMKRMAQIVDKGLDKVKPLLDMIDQTIDEAEKKKENNELDEDAFVSKMKPLIENAHSVMQSTLDQIKALDPDNKFERLAKRHVEDAQASADEKMVIDGCQELSTRVQATIDKGRKAIEGMPKAKSELGPLFSMLSEPLLQILGAVGLLVAGVLNLLANILNALGLGGALTQVLQGLRIDKLLNAMGYSVSGKKK